MRFIPEWFSGMFLGMAILYFFGLVAVLYANPYPPLYIDGVPRVVSVVGWSLTGAIGGAFGYAAGAVVVGWIWSTIKSVYRRLGALTG